MTFGCDISDRYTQICGLDDAGTVVLRQRVLSTQAGFESFFRKRKRARVVLEVGTHSPWISELVAGLGHETFVANPRNLKLITQNANKSDIVDAEMLARLGRADPKLLSPIQHRSKAARQDLAVIRARNALVRTRVMLVNHVRGSVKPFGLRIPKGNSGGETFVERAAKTIPPELEAGMAPVLQVLRTVTEQIKAIDKRLETEVAGRHPEAKLLQQVGGIGAVTSLAYVLTLEDPKRFRKSRQVGAFLGLRPRRNQSGSADPELHINKCGDVYLRALLVQCSQFMLGPFGKDSDLRRWGLALASRGKRNAKKKAVVAVARRLAVLLHRLWVTGEVYQPLGYAGKQAA